MTFTATSIYQPHLMLVVVLVFWFGGAAVMSRIAGWHVVASLYPVPTVLVGEHHRFCTIMLGSEAFSITYRRCVLIVLTAEGMYMRLMLPFRFHSPPFLLPWASIAACVEKRVLFSTKYTFQVKGSNRQITLAGPLGQHVHAKYRAAAEKTTQSGIQQNAGAGAQT